MPITPATFDYFRQLVVQRSAIVLEPGKEYLVESRLTGLARSSGFASVDELARQLIRTPFDSLHRRAVEEMTTNETSFFRDIHPFDAIRKHVMPELLKRRAVEQRLNIWCAACSTGQEPYSISMILREHFPQLRNWKVSILATDISTQVLSRARSGRYSQLEVNRGLPAPLMVRYFTKDGTEWVLKEDIRQMVEYRELNLAERWIGLPQFDVIFMRNVLIYFDVAMKKDILGKIRQVMRPDGWFFLGNAETTMALDERFERAQLDKAVSYRMAGAGARREHAGI
jgi:chemotaxis protein methyltransferase CheR